MSSTNRYNPQEVEEKWYRYWMEKNYFRSVPDDREPYTIVIPPPNVTGVLHMGHLLNNTIQDIYIRKARLEGKNACWVPGTDHASIATEAKVVKKLRDEGTSKAAVGREKFLQAAFEWKEKYGGIILEQLQKLGASCDWERTRFTMEPALSEAVILTFVDLYEKGYIYRGLRMTNWDPQAQTVLSNEEVLHAEENTQLYHIRYLIEGTTDEYLTIATTRPETILGDTAIAVHPDDERYKHLRGKRAVVPIVNRSVPIIFDDYVEMDFGTGALKVTPAHDTNDYDIGQRHGLPTIDVLNPDGTLSEAAQFYIGEDRHKVRKQIAKDLEASGHLVQRENYRNKVGRSERTGAVVEPRLTLQWFVKMEDFARTALQAVERGEVNFHPPHFVNMYRSWLKEDNVRDWCISRQLWWGQRIPAWYYGEYVFVASTEEEALQQAREKTGNPKLQLSDLQQEEDVVDTWFSSWLWPLSVFNGFRDAEELRYYYPTQLLVTGWDIMFFWVARMVMAGYEWSETLLGADFVNQHGRQPFEDVFFTGMVRDEKRQKMSKSLGNSPDALKLIERYGADGVRFGLLSSAAAGNDIVFDAPIDSDTKQVLNESKLCEQGLNFCNKMWNALRLIKGWNTEAELTIPRENELAHRWFEARIRQAAQSIENALSVYRVNDAVMQLYALIWDDFCSWYLEMIKPAYQEPIDVGSKQQASAFFSRLMTLLHPFMPFITEEIWQELAQRTGGEDCIVSAWPKTLSFDEELIEKVAAAQQIISKIRDIRNQFGISKNEPVPLYAPDTPTHQALLKPKGMKEFICKVGGVNPWHATWSAETEQLLSFIVGTDKYFVESSQKIDFSAERERLTNELKYQQGFLNSVEKKLQNQGFVNNAPAQVVDLERKKLADAQARIQALEESLAELEG